MPIPLLEVTIYYMLKVSDNALLSDVVLGDESVDESLHLIKLSVGSESVERLAEWQRANDRYFHVTRMWPKRDKEILRTGGSIYWVIQGLCRARQEITGFEEVIGEDGIRRCRIELARDLVRVEPTRKRPFQGWRYLGGRNAPRDLATGVLPDGGEVPHQLMAALAEIGVR